MRMIDADALIEFCAERWIPLNIDAVNMQPTIQPEKAQLSKEGTTKGTASDLISKTETVEHLRRMLEATVPNTDYDEGFVDGVEFGVSTVSTMPTIQPVATDTNVGDTISRQQAIDAMAELQGRASSKGELTGISKAWKRIKQLPSIQPEPHEGHWIEGGIYRDVIECNCSECGQLMTTAATVRMNYCPNCGARMTISTK